MHTYTYIVLLKKAEFGFLEFGLKFEHDGQWELMRQDGPVCRRIQQDLFRLDQPRVLPTSRWALRVVDRGPGMKPPRIVNIICSSLERSSEKNKITRQEEWKREENRETEKMTQNCFSSFFEARFKCAYTHSKHVMNEKKTWITGAIIIERERKIER